MVQNWIKVEKETARKPEVLRIADILGVHPDHAFGMCIRFWFWCDDQLTDGNAAGVTLVTLNCVIGNAGFAEAMVEVGWLKAIGDGGKIGIQVPNFERHLSQSAKRRGLTSERVRKNREKSNANVTDLLRAERYGCVTRARGESERENLSLKGARRAIGKAQPLRASAEEPVAPNGRSPKDISADGMQAQFDLSEVDWCRVSEWAERLGRNVPARSDSDRRMWLRFAVLADMSFGEGWLVDGTEAVLKSKETKTTKQRHLVAVLKSKAEEHGVSNENFAAMLSRIEIPKAIWKSSVLEIQK